MKDVYRQLCEVIPGGVNSAARAFPGLGRTPLVVQEAREDLLIDVNGKEYIDFCGSWGALIHGHTVPEEVYEQLSMGSSYGVSCLAEERLARKVVEMVPSIEQVRFVSSGTEATMSAVRLARAFTGRETIVKFAGNYHGHADPLLNITPLFPYNEPVQLSDNVAAVIVEPIAGNMGVIPAAPEFLQHLKKECERVGALLIFDEVITGFRVAAGGAQELYGIMPDLTCIGKIVGGGFPAAAFGGRREIMQQLAPVGPVFQAGTLSGNPVAMVAGFAALEKLTPQFYADLEEKTARFLAPIPNVQRVGSMFTLFFGDLPHNLDDVKKCDLEAFKHFFWELFDAGAYISPSQFEACFISAAHTEAHLQYAQQLLTSALSCLHTVA